MPRYIGYTPQFNPISLQEYLAVPTMLQQEFDTYEEKYNENLDKLAALEGMLDESTKDYLNAYKGQLQNAADIISGKSGDLGALRQQTNAARQFYREYAPKLTGAYTRRQEDLKAQRKLELKDPSAITTKIGDMRSYLNNPDQRFYALSGDKIYSDMVNAGKMSAADITKNSIGKAGVAGYLSQMTRKGYTLAEQQQYASLVQQVLYGETPEIRAAADKALRENEIYAQPYQVLSKYIEDNKFNAFNNTQQDYAINRALSGQLMGMTGNEDEKLISDKAWEEARADARALATKGSKTTTKPDGWNTAPKIYNMFVETQENLPKIKEQLQHPNTSEYGKKYSPFNHNGYLRERGSVSKMSAPSMASTTSKVAGEKLEEQIYTILDYYLAQGDQKADYKHRTMTREDILEFVNKYEQEHDFAFGRAIANRDIDKEASTDLQQNLQGYSIWETNMNSDGTYSRGKLLKKDDDFFNEKKFTIRQLQYDQYTSTLLARGGIDKSGKTKNQDHLYEISLDRVGYLERQQIETLTQYWQDATEQGDYNEASEILNEIMSIVDNSITLSKTKKQ